MSTTKTQRIVSLVLALLFLGSTIGGIAYYILATQSQQSQDQQIQAALNQQTNSGGKKLQGTKLSNYNPVGTVSSLQIIDLTQGTGAEVKAGDTVTVNYTGATASDGTIFQSSLDSGQAVSFPLNQVIAGWTKGIPGMKVGGTRRLIIPSNLAYGANPPQGSGIPANAALVFDVQLLKIGQ
ncbi:MAG TPA: FKBP-type peptidyl-prolyl cis-trans isomerase [Patescibacteria group bacterium]|nr:FKBP-type peptidyl-prolyl cis-trans isomerase [Patescibacteria group bacterium]